MKSPLIVTVVGARPQFIKASVVSMALRKKAREILVHTGQHYDYSMSGSFFKELGLPNPDYNLGVGSGPHGQQVGRMMEKLESILMKLRPDWVLVYGDTNSTLAGALAAAKLHIRIAHVEAGLRSFNRKMPEEINRVLTDHVSGLLFCPGPSAVLNLRKEGVRRGVRVVGDVMREALLQALSAAKKRSGILEKAGLKPGAFALATIHRAENTDDPVRFGGILRALKVLAAGEPLVWPLHPRARRILGEAGLRSLRLAGVRVLGPASYLDMIRLESASRLILTDSGGVQKEAWWLGIPCVTLRDETEWPETLAGNRNVLGGAGTTSILAAAKRARAGKRIRSASGAGAAIAKALILNHV